MHIGQVPFGRSVGYTLKSPADKAQILNELQVYGISLSDKQFDKFSAPNSARAIKTKPHLLCVRTQGCPYYLYLTTSFGVSHCIFVERRFQNNSDVPPKMILTKLWFDVKLFSGTVFEGELVRQNDNRWVFILTDILVKQQDILHNLNLVKRINLLYDILNTDFTSDALDPCRLQIKRYFLYDQLRELQEFISTLPYNVTGIIFKSLYLKFRDVVFEIPMSRQQHQLASATHAAQNALTNLKESFGSSDGSGVSGAQCQCSESGLSGSDDGSRGSVGRLVHSSPNKQSASNVDSDNNMDSDESSGASMKFCREVHREQMFKVWKTYLPDVYELALSDEASETKETACIPDLKTSKFMELCFKDKRHADCIELACTYSETFKRWVPVIPSAK